MCGDTVGVFEIVLAVILAVDEDAPPALDGRPPHPPRLLLQHLLGGASGCVFLGLLCAGFG